MADIYGSPVINDTLVGTSADDNFYSSTGNDSVNGGLGNDTHHYENGNDTVDGGLGDDTLDLTTFLDWDLSDLVAAEAADDGLILGGAPFDWTINLGGANGIVNLLNTEFIKLNDATIDLSKDNLWDGTAVLGSDQSDGADDNDTAWESGTSGAQTNTNLADDEATMFDVSTGSLGDLAGFSILSVNGTDVTDAAANTLTVAGGSLVVAAGATPTAAVYEATGVVNLRGGYNEVGTIDLVLTDGTNTVNSEVTLVHVDHDNVLNQSAATAAVNIKGGDDYDGDAMREAITGSAFGDTLVGGGANDLIQAGAGDDTVFAGEDSTNGGDDLVQGQAGADTIGGGFGNDILVGDSIVTKTTATFNTDSTTNAGGGNTASAVTTGAATDGSDVIWGGAGDDLIITGSWDDAAGTGDDGIADATDAAAEVLGVAADVAWAGAGDDVVVGAGGDDMLGGGLGDDVIYGNDGDDTIYGGADDGATTNADDIFGGAGDDVIYAGVGNDTIDGGDGDDTIYNGKGNDQVTAGEGNDILWAGEGNDTFTGAWGASNANQAAEEALDGVDATADFDTYMIVSNGGQDTIHGFDKLDNAASVNVDDMDVLDFSNVTTKSINNISELLDIADTGDFGLGGAALDLQINLGDGTVLYIADFNNADLQAIANAGNVVYNAI
ncbi:beta strand repeat-containing protein [Pseudokordiimonas caeni]|uniref:beta strand repeat-containing protein n=1 Tax=Pseudokordiimonas caeni TaxID=2997908 RepID=UPI00281171ED|nr:calcium-binding protein [Pseudokordiimonas caeni]